MLIKKMEGFSAYLVGGTIYETFEEVKDLIQFCIEDFTEHNDKILDIPTVLRGFFIGYKNEHKYYCGYFSTEDGQVYQVLDQDKAISVSQSHSNRLGSFQL